ncbi:MAG: hypothetical protein U5N85_09870 [Arcicella sp.]|nr:hypothetical protein [Arcicella sp.]
MMFQNQQFKAIIVQEAVTTLWYGVEAGSDPRDCEQEDSYIPSPSNMNVMNHDLRNKVTIRSLQSGQGVIICPLN